MKAYIKYASLNTTLRLNCVFFIYLFIHVCMYAFIYLCIYFGPKTRH